jgi:hypothetical protein
MKVQPPMVVDALKVRLVRFEVPKKAVPVGTASGVQLDELLKLLLRGTCFQVASCAAAGIAATSDAAIMAVLASNGARL